MMTSTLFDPVKGLAPISTAASLTTVGFSRKPVYHSSRLKI
jgi:hypothetical protein